MGWFDRSGLLYSQKSDFGDALNGILNLAFLILIKEKTSRDVALPMHITNARQYVLKVKDGGKVYDGLERNGKASHDDMTGIVSTFYSGNIGKVDPWPYVYRPAEFMLYSIWNGSSIAKLGTLVISTKLIFSCWRTYRAKNGAIETDGKLLAWLILERFHFPLTKKLCYAGIKHHFGKNWLPAMLEIKYPDADHPIRLEAAKGWKSN